MRLKELNEEKLKELSTVQLYNLLFGPAAKIKKECDELNEHTIVAVLGATVIPIERRVKALDEIMDKPNMDSVIFSGGFGWQGIQLNQLSEDKISERYRDPKVREIIVNRAMLIFEKCPGLREKVMHDLFNYDNDSENFKDCIINKMDENKDFRSYMLDEFDRCKKGNNIEFNEWLDSYIDSIIFNYIIHYITESEIMQLFWGKQQEDKKKEENDKFEVILESESTNTKENAEFCLYEFLKAKIKNPDINSMIVVTEWPYFHRSILTTDKALKSIDGITKHALHKLSNLDKKINDSIEDIMNSNNTNEIVELRKLINLRNKLEDEIFQVRDQYRLCMENGGINVTGYPAVFDKWKIGADWSYDSYDDFIKSMNTELLKEIQYGDVADCEIEEFIDYPGMYPGGPRIAINGIMYNEKIGKIH